MKLSKKKTLKILAYCTTAAIFLGGTNIASAAGNVRPTNPSSGNEVTVNENNYTINGERSSHDGIFHEFDGGYNTSGEASRNTLVVNGGRFTRFLNGGYVTGIGNTNYNNVTIFGGTFDEWVEGGWAVTGNANFNTLTINGGIFNTAIIDGGYTVTGNTNSNTVNINGGIFNNSGDDSGIYGGYVAGSGNANDNVVNISGGKISGNIYGGYVRNSGSVNNNTINISGNPDLSSATLIAARGNSAISVGNKINISTKNIFAQNVSGFQSINFYIPAGISSGDTMLTLTNGKTDLTSTTLNVSAFGGANLQTGNQINLLKNPNGIEISNLKPSETIAQGISLDYGLSLALNDDGTAYTATVGQVSDLKPQTDALNMGGLSASNSVTNGTDNLVGAFSNENLGESVPTTQFNPFAGISGSVFKIKTSDGQKLKSKNAGIDVGMARYVRNAGGLLLFGPVTDYGRDSYDSSYTHSKVKGGSEMYTTNGYGNSHYFAAGIIARQMNTNALGVPDGMYYEGSFRAGRVHTNFASDNFLVHNNPTHADYSASTPCFAGHVRIGWAGNIGGTSKLDAYAMYSRNRVNGFTTRLSTGEEYKFSAVNSGRIRIGARLSRDYNIHTFYSGLAYIQEFSGATHGEYMGRPTGRSSLRGTSGMLELGWRVKQSATSDTMFDVYANGWVGHQKGVTFTAKFRRDF